MAELFILLPAHEGQPPVYAWRAGGAWQAGEHRPDGRGGKGEGAVAIVPGTSVTVHHVDVVARKPAEARRTALFALEDDVAEPIEGLHIALGRAGDGLQREIHVVSLADMRAWLDELDALGLPDAGIIAAQSTLPHDGMAIQGPDEFLFRTAKDALAIDRTAPDDLVRLIAPDAIETVYGDKLSGLLGREASGDAASNRTDWLIQLASWYAQRPDGRTVSLRQGDFAVKQALHLEGLSRWRSAGILAAACFAVWIASIWFETSALRNQTNELRARTGEILTAAVPESQGSVTQGLAILRQDQRLTGNTVRPTIASAALYEALQPTKNAEIRSMRFDAANGRLTAVVIFDNYSESDAIGDRLEEAGLSVALGEARQSGNRVLGEFVIEAAS